MKNIRNEKPVTLHEEITVVLVMQLSRAVTLEPLQMKLKEEIYLENVKEQ
jgi:hypothetical protein